MKKIIFFRWSIKFLVSLCILILTLPTIIFGGILATCFIGDFFKLETNSVLFWGLGFLILSALVAPLLILFYKFGCKLKEKIKEDIFQKNLVFHESKPEFWQLLKIYWSQVWRTFIWQFLLFFLCLSIYIFADQSQSLADMNPELLIIKFGETHLASHYKKIYIILFIIRILSFTYVITKGIKYKNFVLSIFPKTDWKTSGYWTTTFYASWAYCWRFALLSGGFYLTRWITSNYYGFTSVNSIFFMANIILEIYLVSYVVNKQYGIFRLSFLKWMPVVKEQ